MEREHPCRGNLYQRRPDLVAAGDARPVGAPARRPRCDGRRRLALAALARRSGGGQIDGRVGRQA